MKEILKFDILPPNTVLTLEGQTKVSIAYLVLFGNIRFFKFDQRPPQAHSLNGSVLPQTQNNVSEMIAKQAYGRQITNVCLNDTKTNDSKLFFGSETELEDGLISPYTIITSASDLTVVYKVLPEQLKELLRHEKKCLRAIQRRFQQFYQTIDKMRNTSLKG